MSQEVPVEVSLGAWNSMFFQVRCPRMKGKYSMSAKHVEKVKRQKGPARPKPMSNCLCKQYSTWLLPVPTFFGLRILALFSIQQNGLLLNKGLQCSPLSYSLEVSGTEQETQLSSTWVGFLAILQCKLTRNPFSSRSLQERRFERKSDLCSALGMEGLSTSLWEQALDCDWSTGISNCMSYGSMLKGNHTDTRHWNISLPSI